MTLRVPYADFAAAAHRYEIAEVYVSSRSGSTELTGLMKAPDRVLYSCTELPPDQVKTELTKAGLSPFDGVWSAEPPEPDVKPLPGEVFIAAVSYQSDEPTPGIWLDAYPWLPTPVQVLRNLYDEFRDTGELSEVPFEEFVRLANPNVVVVSPHEIDGYLAEKSEN